MNLDQISIDKIVPKDVIVEIIEKQHVDGNVSEQELKIISQIVAYFKPETIFEFGTFDGRTTINMALNSPANTKIYTLDLPATQANSTKYPLAVVSGYSDNKYILKSESGTRYKNKKGSEKIIQLYNDSAAFDYSPYKKKMNLIFIDGSHAKQYTKNDTEAALSMIKEGGIILWHDYANVWPDVTEALNEYVTKDDRFSNIKHILETTLAILRV